MVERYRFWCQDSDAEISREPNGGWVRYDDYARLQEQVEAQLAETQRAWNERDGEKRGRLAAEAERDRLAARLSENNRWPDPLQSPQAEAIRAGKVDMTEIVSLFDKMERELEQLRFVAADNARLEAENDNGGDLTRCEFCGRPILGRIVMDVNFTPSCEECAGAAAIPVEIRPLGEGE